MFELPDCPKCLHAGRHRQVFVVRMVFSFVCDVCKYKETGRSFAELKYLIDTYEDRPYSRHSNPVKTPIQYVPAPGKREEKDIGFIERLLRLVRG
jgi:hypothetical protein